MSGASFTTRDGCRLAYADEGRGLPVLWQHGLGADRGQPAEVFPTIDGMRRITLECRGHGESDLGGEPGLSIAQFADDALALLDHLGIERAVVGGISLGAAIALRLAARHPERVTALVLARPAWVDEAAPASLRIYRDVAELLAEHGPLEGAKRFEASACLAEVEAVSPDNAASMRWFFERRDPASTVALLRRIPADGPGVSREQMSRLALPVLVIANGEDFVHSIETARALSRLIPAARLVVITSKTVSRSRYVDEFEAALRAFIEPLRGTKGVA